MIGKLMTKVLEAGGHLEMQLYCLTLIINDLRKGKIAHYSFILLVRCDHR